VTLVQYLPNEGTSDSLHVNQTRPIGMYHDREAGRIEARQRVDLHYIILMWNKTWPQRWNCPATTEWLRQRYGRTARRNRQGEPAAPTVTQQPPEHLAACKHPKRTDSAKQQRQGCQQPLQMLTTDTKGATHRQAARGRMATVFADSEDKSQTEAEN